MELSRVADTTGTRYSFGITPRRPPGLAGLFFAWGRS